MGLRAYLGLKRKPATNVARDASPVVDLAAIYAGKQFNTDWISEHAPVWERVLDPHRERVADVLEIGSFEGRSSIYILELFPKSRITCVDVFGDNDFVEFGLYLDALKRHDLIEPMRKFVPLIEQRFDANLAPYAGRVRKLRARSAAALDLLADEGAAFDLIYVDGSHRRDYVLADSVLAWRLLRVDSVMIWDDYGWLPDTVPEMVPKQAIDLFLYAFAGCFRELHRGYQVIVEKTVDWPEKFSARAYR
jgi:hypothetical protein